MGGSVVLFGYKTRPALIQTAERYANTYGLDLRVLDMRSRDFIFQRWEHIRDARFALIYNGTQHQSGLMARLAERRGIPSAFIEWGLCPQSETWTVDPKGFCGDSVLNGPLNWINDRDRALLARERALMHLGDPPAAHGPDARTLLVLQVAADTQVVYHTNAPDMQSVVDHIEGVFPAGSLEIRPHPKASAEITSTRGSRVERSGTLMEAMARCRAVIGLTSTSLYEAAVYGRSVLALGDHPLRTHAATQHDDVAAGVLALRIDRETGNPADVLERFGVWPLGCGPRRLAVAGGAA